MWSVSGYDISVMIRSLAAGWTGGRVFFLPFSLDDVGGAGGYNGVHQLPLVSLWISILIDFRHDIATFPRTIFTLNRFKLE